jgi:hypothetical protein
LSEKGFYHKQPCFCLPCKALKNAPKSKVEATEEAEKPVKKGKKKVGR